MRRIPKKLMRNNNIKKEIYIYRTTLETAIDIIGLRLISTSEREEERK